MLNSQKKIQIEWQKETEAKENSNITMINPITSDICYNNIFSMVKKILQEEIPQLRNNSLMYSLVLYSLIEQMNTVQTLGNVLSYIKKQNIKKVHDVNINNGEIKIKCLV